ncbi:RagB/SusD family nutrient uptake outer membrane protein [Pseudobacter ginsenosidimutans]|uniref:SusD-like starch-binding protein associating with outer membrane n=1 Tax=Pseudobacter ginsenosidimutans TaxID=661488 RepID=A0A4Q7MZY6_9BACT|nr:RagB/SusD family nutrient uptake outer membrane protein [Pseudobacter ginsenosidimutans]QEC43481.1 RagB/SusD family nutrient uptake outer membrane protein [Pseudobacter ginsenosidimutans]RZS74867.1 SusD-like starch-binding protein associating with outer membrane [Pseudobacter ginsenosidimutans]
MRKNNPIQNISLALLMVASLSSCEKLITADEPTDTITTVKIFDTEAKAEMAIAGAYNSMINGNGQDVYSSAYGSFAAGLASIAGGYAAGELINFNNSLNANEYVLVTSKMTATNTTIPRSLWSSCYYVIYNANTVIEGISASTSPKLRDSVRKEIIAEAKFIRAFCYFYLVNFFGDLPIALSGDFNNTASLSRSPVQEVYKQIMADLKDAEAGLAADYSVGRGKRVRVNKYAAIALQARVHLFLGENELAAARATDVINHTTLYNLEPNIEDVFRTTSKEAIFQLMQTEKDNVLRNATPFGYSSNNYLLQQGLLDLFETGDLRKQFWIRNNNLVNKYTIINTNAVVGAPAREYYMALRLGELYLIRAEARANGAAGGLTGAIEDLNALRRRADIDELDETLGETDVKAAIEKERQTELFAEWGSRWFDLKRTGKALEVLNAMPLKQPWEGDHQLLMPLPPDEISRNNKIIQNPGYTSL